MKRTIALILLASSFAHAYDWQAEQRQQSAETWRMIEAENQREQQQAIADQQRRDQQQLIFEQQQARYQAEDAERAREREDRLRRNY